MNAKNIFLFLAVAVFVFWVVTKENAPAKVESLTAGQQKQMEKAADMGKELQDNLDQRMQASPSEQ